MRKELLGGLMVHCYNLFLLTVDALGSLRGRPLVATLPPKYTSPGIENFRGLVERRKVVHHEQHPSNISMGVNFRKSGEIT